MGQVAAPEPDDRESKIKRLLMLQERARRAASAPLCYYSPHPGQVRIHDAVKEARIVLASCGNRFGKSHSNAAEAVSRAYGYRIWEVPNLKLKDGDYPPREDVPREYWYLRPDGSAHRNPCRIRVVTGLGLVEGIGNVMWPKIESMLTPACRTHPDFHVRRGAFGVPVSVTLPNGSSFHMGSAEQKPMAFEGSDFDHALMDEPPIKAIWTPIWRGLTDRSGSVLITATPVGPAAPWLYDSMVIGDLSEMTLNIQGSIWDNPHVPDENKKEFLAGGGMTDEERQARESGAWTALTFRAFPMFDPAAHIVPALGWHDIPPGWSIMCVIDPAHRRPWAVIWIAIEPRADGQYLIFDEFPNSDHSLMRSSTLTIDDYVQEIARRELGRPVHARVLDPRFGKAKPRIKGEVYTSIQDDFAERGYFFDCEIEGAEAEETGIERIRQLLRFDREMPLGPLNTPRLRVSANCINSIMALQMSNFVPPSARDLEALPDKLNEKFKDFRDCIRYGAIYPYAHGLGHQQDYISDEDFQRENDSSDFWD